MTTYELCKKIRTIIVNRAAEVMNYTTWSDDFAAKEIREIPELILDNSDFSPVQPAELTSAEMDDLGFGKWEKGNPMRLIPLWLFPFLADKIDCICINGKSGKLKRSEMNNDHRGGFLAYGVIPKA